MNLCMNSNHQRMGESFVRYATAYNQYECPRDRFTFDVSITGGQTYKDVTLLLCHLNHGHLDFIQAFADPLADDVGCLGVGLGDNVSQFLHVR